MKTTTTYRQKDGSWQIIVSWKDENGRWRQKSRQGFARKSDAKEAEAELIAQIKNTPQPLDKAMADISLTDFCDVYLKNNQRLALGTKRAYKTAVKSLRRLANKPMHTVTYLDLQTVISAWNTKPGTQKNYKNKLVVLFRAAVKPYRIIPVSPMADIEIARERQKKTIRIVEEAVFRKIIKEASGELRLALLIGWFTGMRRAEILALTWDDISFTKSEISVTKQVTFEAGTTGTVKYTKSANGYRSIPVPTALLKELKAYKAEHPLRIDKAIFPVPRRTYRHMWELLRKYDATPHYLRHSYGTRLIANGVDIQTVAALLGDDVNTVINTYIHYTDEMRKAAAKDIQKIFAANF